MAYVVANDASARDVTIKHIADMGVWIPYSDTTHLGDTLDPEACVDVLVQVYPLCSGCQ